MQGIKYKENFFMRQNWNVRDMHGMEHTIIYKSGFGISVTIDGVKQKIKSMNWAVVMIDHPIQFPGVECRLVVLGNKPKLAVNGRYLGSGEEYMPLSAVPKYATVFAAVSLILGAVLNGMLGAIIGALLGACYIRIAAANSKAMTIGIFAAGIFAQFLLFFFVSFALGPVLYR